MMENRHQENRSDQDLRISNESQYPPRTSSVSKASEVLGKVNTLRSVASPPQRYQAPRGFFGRLLPKTINPNWESNETAPTSEITSHSNRPQSPLMPHLSASSSTSSNYVYGVDELDRATASEPSLQLSHSSSVYSDIRNSNPHHRHSSFFPSSQPNEEGRGLVSQPFSAANGRTSSRHSHHLELLHSLRGSPLTGSNNTSPSNDLEFIESRPVPINTPIQSSPSLPEASKGGETAAKEALRRSATGTSMASLTSEYSGDQSEVSQASTRSKVKSWAANLKKWGFGGRTKVKPTGAQTKENATSKKISWRRSTADLLSSYTGGNRKGEDKERFFLKKQRPTTTVFLQHQQRSAQTLTHEASSDSLHQKSELPLVREQSTDLTPLHRNHHAQISKASRYPSPEVFSSKETTQLGCVEHAQKLSEIYHPRSSSSSMAIDPQQRFLGNYTPRDYSKLDNDDDGDNKSNEDEDDTITLKTYKENLFKSKVYVDSMERRENQPQLSKQQRVQEIFESDFDSMFRVNLSTDGYGIFSRLLQRSAVLSFEKGQRSRENLGLECFSRILSYLTPPQIIALAQTSTRIHAATMNAIFEKILFKPGSSCIASILALNIAPAPDIVSATLPMVGSEDLQETKNVFALVEEMRQLEGMLCGSREKTKQSNGSFIKSLIFDSSWRIPGKYWKIMIPALEKLLTNGKIEGIVTFVWNLDIPITSGLMTSLASQESLTTLSLNCFHPQLHMDGNANRILPRPLNKLGGLVVLELQRLGLCGGLAWESDRQYIREVFGVIIRSPTLKILRLGAGDYNTALPLSAGGFEEAVTAAERTEKQSKEDNIIGSHQVIRAWVDLPVFDYDLFRDVYHTIKINRNASDTRQNASTSPLKNSYINFTARKHMYGIKELSLDGFIIDQRLLNSEDFADGGLETLRFTRCYYIPRYNVDSPEAHILLGKELRKSIRKLTLDEGILSSVGENNVKKVINELLYVSLPCSQTSEGDISRHNTTRRKQKHLRELFILSSSYRGFEPSNVPLNTSETLKSTVVAQMEAFQTAEKTQDLYENKVEVLALSPGWKFREGELGWLMESTMSLGLKELAIDIADNSWDHFLEIVPNIRNLTALYLYTPRTHILRRGPSSDLSNAVSMTIPLTRQSRLITIKPTGKLLKASFEETSSIQISDKAGLLAEDSNNPRHFVYTSTGRRRRYPIDDASDILRSIVTNLYEETKQEVKATKGKEVRRFQYHETESVPVLGNGGHPNLAWVSIGRALWQVVRLEPRLQPQNLDKLDTPRSKGITEVEFLSNRGQKYQTETNQRWGLKRQLTQDASKAGIKIFSLGKQSRIEDE